MLTININKRGKDGKFIDFKLPCLKIPSSLCEGQVKSGKILDDSMKYLDTETIDLIEQF